MDQPSEQKKEFASAPPEAEITIRTMDSDVKSIEQGGGEIGAPQVFAPQETRAPRRQEQVRASLDLPGYTGPEKSIFGSPASVSSSQQPNIQPASRVLPQKTENAGGKWKITAIIIGVLILVVALVLLGYFVIFPWLFPSQMPAVQ